MLIRRSIFAALTLAPAAAGAGDSVIIDATGSSAFSRGRAISAEARVTLADGSALTLITAGGDVVRLVGPYDGAPLRASVGATARRGERTVDRLSDILAHSGRPDGALIVGAVRGIGSGAADANEPDPWAIDLAVDGPQCVRGPKGLRLRHPAHSGFRSLVIQRQGSAEKAALDWPVGAAAIDWPAGVGVVDGATYLVRIPGPQAEIRRYVQLYLAPPDLSKPGELALWATERGCDGQIMRIIDSVAARARGAPSEDAPGPR